MVAIHRPRSNSRQLTGDSPTQPTEPPVEPISDARTKPNDDADDLRAFSPPLLTASPVWPCRYVYCRYVSVNRRRDARAP